MFWKPRRTPQKTYDPKQFRPVIRSSICTGEQVAGFRNLETGKFQEIQLLRSDSDLREFMDTYAITEVPPTEY